MSERVIFLDVDGVLNHAACDWHNQGPDVLDSECVRRVREAAEKADASIVLSSSWRGLEPSETALIRSGVLDRWHLTDPRTRRLESISKGGVYIARIRGDEIAEWLSRHPEVEAYAIIDDEADMLSKQMPRFIQTDFNAGGFRPQHAERLAALFTEREDERDEI